MSGKGPITPRPKGSVQLAYAQKAYSPPAAQTALAKPFLVPATLQPQPPVKARPLVAESATPPHAQITSWLRPATPVVVRPPAAASGLRPELGTTVAASASGALTPRAFGLPEASNTSNAPTGISNALALALRHLKPSVLRPKAPLTAPPKTLLALANKAGDSKGIGKGKPSGPTVALRTGPDEKLVDKNTEDWKITGNAWKDWNDDSGWTQQDWKNKKEGWQSSRDKWKTTGNSWTSGSSDWQPSNADWQEPSGKKDFKKKGRLASGKFKIWSAGKKKETDDDYGGKKRGVGSHEKKIIKGRRGQKEPMMNGKTGANMIEVNWTPPTKLKEDTSPESQDMPESKGPAGRGRGSTLPSWMTRTGEDKPPSIPEQARCSSPPKGPAGRGRGSTLPAWMKQGVGNTPTASLDKLPSIPDLSEDPGGAPDQNILDEVFQERGRPAEAKKMPVRNERNDRSRSPRGRDSWSWDDWNETECDESFGQQEHGDQPATDYSGGSSSSSQASKTVFIVPTCKAVSPLAPIKVSPMAQVVRPSIVLPKATLGPRPPGVPPPGKAPGLQFQPTARVAQVVSAGQNDEDAGSVAKVPQVVPVPKRILGSVAQVVQPIVPKALGPKPPMIPPPSTLVPAAKSMPGKVTPKAMLNISTAVSNLQAALRNKLDSW